MDTSGGIQTSFPWAEYQPELIAMPENLAPQIDPFVEYPLLDDYFA